MSTKVFLSMRANSIAASYYQDAYNKAREILKAYDLQGVNTGTHFYSQGSFCKYTALKQPLLCLGDIDFALDIRCNTRYPELFHGNNDISYPWLVSFLTYFDPFSEGYFERVRQSNAIERVRELHALAKKILRTVKAKLNKCFRIDLRFFLRNFIRRHFKNMSDCSGSDDIYKSGSLTVSCGFIKYFNTSNHERSTKRRNHSGSGAGCRQQARVFVSAAA